LSRPVTKDTHVTTQSDDSHLIATERVGRRFAELGTEYNANVNISQAFHRFVAGTTQSIWDLNYESFQSIMRTVISGTTRTIWIKLC